MLEPEIYRWNGTIDALRHFVALRPERNWHLECEFEEWHYVAYLVGD